MEKLHQPRSLTNEDIQQIVEHATQFSIEFRKVDKYVWISG